MGPSNPKNQNKKNKKLDPPDLIWNSYFALLLVQLSDRIDQRVGSQDDASALGPLRAHQYVLTQKDLTDVLGPGHTDQGFSQQVGLKDVAMFLSPGDVKAGTLSSERNEKQRRSESSLITMRKQTMAGTGTGSCIG